MNEQDLNPHQIARLRRLTNLVSSTEERQSDLFYVYDELKHDLYESEADKTAIYDSLDKEYKLYTDRITKYHICTQHILLEAFGRS